MKNLLIAIFAMIALFACSPQQSSEVVEVLSANTFHDSLQSDNDIQLIDVRTASEYEQGHIHNSVNLDFLNGDFENSISSLNKEEAVYLYCHSGNRSGKAAKLLEKNGFTKVYDLRSGYSNWPYKKEGE